MKRNSLILLCVLCLLLSACAAPAEETVAAEPDAESTAEPTAEPEAELTDGFSVQISEVMAANKATLADEDGNFPDWVELYNPSDEELDLRGCSLRCGGDSQVLAQAIAAGEYALVFCRDFGISADGETLALLSPDGGVIDEWKIPATEPDTSVTPDGVSLWPTPGYENSREGYAAFQNGRTVKDLAIGEAAVYDPKGDWVELVNNSRKPLNLSDYCLSDKGKQRLLCPLPDQSIEPGERTVLLCADLGMSFNAERDQLYLSCSDGTLVDYVNLHSIPLGGSMGRMEEEGGFFYFEKPSPFEANEEGCRDVAPTPVLLGKDGVYDGVEQVKVDLHSPGEIHYTLDGSTPTADSPAYDGPIVLTGTTVLRAVTVQEGSLASEALNLSYILNEEHTLPVVSLVCDPELIFGRGGIYTNPAEHWEVPGAVSFYDGEEGFSLECGVKIHGATSRIVQRKKSFKLCFRSRYEGMLGYDLFDNGVTEFSSILLRADQEGSETSYLRDNVMHQLARDAFPELPRQDYRPAVLYINGEYWGLYNIREAHSAHHYAQHTGANPDAVTQWQGAWDSKGDFAQIYRFALHNDLTDPDNYAYVAEHLDVDSVIAWCIVQVYSGNIDFNSPNMRFYWDAEREVLSYALVDLDLGMFDYGDFRELFGFGYAYTELAARMSRNPVFRDRLCTEMARALTGPMSDEAVLEKIDEMAEELRPEVARDRARWGGSEKTWNHIVEALRVWVKQSGSHAKFMVWSLNKWYHLSSAEREEYFSEIH